MELLDCLFKTPATLEVCFLGLIRGVTDENHFGDLVDCFPDTLKNVSSEDFFRAVNVIEPSLIRVESDESTYDFHIMLRVDIESMLVDKSLKVDDLPSVWNEQIDKYLGLKVPNDSDGVLQDIHWSGGQFGTFCNYTIGNVMAAQLISTMDHDKPKIRDERPPAPRIINSFDLSVELFGPVSSM